MKDDLINNSFLATAKIIECPTSHIVIDDIPFELATRQIIAKIPNTDTSTDELDVNELVKSQLQFELVRDIQYDLYTKYLIAGHQNQEDALSRFRLFLAKKLNIQPKIFIGGVSVEQAAFDLANLILKNKAYDGEAFCVLSSPLASLLPYSQHFKPSSEIIASHHGHIYPIGEIFGIQVFVDSSIPSWSDDTVLIGKIKSGVTIGIKDLAFIETSAFIENPFGDKNFAINGRIIIVENPTRCSSYQVIRISSNKKPFLRKLFNL